MSAPSVDPRYPIGPFALPAQLSDEERALLAERMRVLPERLLRSVAHLDATQLDTPYRDGGWTVRQVVHHLGDSHANALMRFKLGLTEVRPVIRPYDENTWLQTADVTTTPLGDALDFVEVLHRRLYAIARSITAESGAREIVHPDSGILTVDQLLAMYAWHGDHHVAHLTTLRVQQSW